jgi:hypothetical protein
MLLSTFLFSFYFCFPSIPLDKILHEESRLFSKFIKDQCWQKVKLYYEKLASACAHIIITCFSSLHYLEGIQKDGDWMLLVMLSVIQ